MIERRVAYRPVEAAEAIGVSKPFIDRLIADGELRSAKIGGIRLIDRRDLEDYVQRQVERTEQSGSQTIREG